MSNHLITKNYHSEPFYGYWLLVEFIPWHPECPEEVDYVDPNWSLAISQLAIFFEGRLDREFGPGNGADHR